jgi:hypothetical protein
MGLRSNGCFGWQELLPRVRVIGKWQVAGTVRSCSLMDGRMEMIWENVLIAGWMDGWMGGCFEGAG